MNRSDGSVGMARSQVRQLDVEYLSSSALIATKYPNMCLASAEMPSICRAFASTSNADEFLSRTVLREYFESDH